MSEERDIQKLANLARLSLSAAEAQKFTKDLGPVFEYVSKLQSAEVSGIEPMSHVHGATNVFRDDVVRPSLDSEKAFSNAPDRAGRFFRTPLIIE